MIAVNTGFSEYLLHRQCLRLPKGKISTIPQFTHHDNYLRRILLRTLITNPIFRIVYRFLKSHHRRQKMRRLDRKFLKQAPKKKLPTHMQIDSCTMCKQRLCTQEFSGTLFADRMMDAGDQPSLERPKNVESNCYDFLDILTKDFRQFRGGYRLRQRCRLRQCCQQNDGRR